MARAPKLGKVSSRGAVPLPMSRIELLLPPSTNVLCRSNRGRSTMYTDWQQQHLHVTAVLRCNRQERCRKLKAGGVGLEEVACKIGSNFGPSRIEGVTNCPSGVALPCALGEPLITVSNEKHNAL